MPAIGCPRCGGQLQLDDQYVGWQVRCPHCGDEFAATAPEVGAAPPAGPYPHQPWVPGPTRTAEELMEYAARQADPVGLALQIVGWVMAALAGLGGLALTGMMVLAAQGAGGGRNNDEGVLIVLAVLGAVVSAVGLVYFAVMAYGGGRAKRLGSWGWGLASSIMATATVLGLCSFNLPGMCAGLLVLPFGVWGLVIMLNNDVKAGFAIAAARRPGPGAGGTA
jgi:hypothetical protein